MKKIIAFSIALMSFNSLHVSAKNNDLTVVDNLIRDQVKKGGGTEYKDARKMLYGDLNQDGQIDLTVYYSIEGIDGGNNHFEYVSVFLANNGVLKPTTSVEVGGDGLYRQVSLVAVKNNYIELKTLDYGPDDARCCPSIEGKNFYIFENGSLKEKKNESKLSTDNSQDQINKIKIENATWKKVAGSEADEFFNSTSFRTIDGYNTFDIINENGDLETLQVDCIKNSVRSIGSGMFKTDKEVDFKPFVNEWVNIKDSPYIRNFYKIACEKNKN